MSDKNNSNPIIRPWDEHNQNLAAQVHPTD
jgi:hypothetical protein